MTITIREPKITDATALIQLFKKLDSETTFMLFEPDERSFSIESQQQKITQFLNTENRQMLVAATNQQVVGIVVGNGGNARRNRHVLSIAIGIEQAFAGQGLGFQLMQAIEVWAVGQNFHRTELTVMAHNLPGISLYTKCGYEKEGVKRHSIKVDGKYVDEIQMAKLLVV